MKEAQWFSFIEVSKGIQENFKGVSLKDEGVSKRPIRLI